MRNLYLTKGGIRINAFLTTVLTRISESNRAESRMEKITCKKLLNYRSLHIIVRLIKFGRITRDTEEEQEKL
jgi:hypothetical protein